MYQRMLDEHAKINASKHRERHRRDSYLLSIDELQRLAKAQIHPDNRKADLSSAKEANDAHLQTGN